MQPPDARQPVPGASEVHLWACLAHAAVFAGFVVPLGNFLAPLIIGYLRPDPFTRHHVHESLNFQITVNDRLLPSTSSGGGGLQRAVANRSKRVKPLTSHLF